MPSNRATAFVRLLALTWSIALAGCGASFELTLPDSFVRLEDEQQAADGYELRAVSNDGVVIAMQVIEHRVEGTLTFWSEAVLRRLRDQAGYALLSADDVQAASGQPGRILRLGRDLNGHVYRYTVVVYVTAASIFIAEAGGPEAAFVAVEADVETALRNVRLD